MRKIYNWKEKKARESQREFWEIFSIYTVNDENICTKTLSNIPKLKNKLPKLYAKLVIPRVIGHVWINILPKLLAL